MSLARVALIGGTGTGPLLASMSSRPVRVPTPFGTFHAALTDSATMLVKRHREGHSVPPHRIEFRAIADGLRRSGVKVCLATAAVGSLRRDWPTGTIVIVRDFLDLSFRRSTLYDREVVHTDVTEPAPAAHYLLDAARLTGIEVADGGVYANLDGPRYETKAEIAMLASLGAGIVGMTAGTEAILLSEARVEYGCIAVVSNLAAGMEATTLDHEDVVHAMNARSADLTRLLQRALELAGKE